MPLILTLWRQRQTNLCEFQNILANTVSSGPAKTTWWDSVLRNKIRFGERPCLKRIKPKAIKQAGHFIVLLPAHKFTGTHMCICHTHTCYNLDNLLLCHVKPVSYKGQLLYDSFTCSTDSNQIHKPREENAVLRNWGDGGSSTAPGADWTE